MKVSSLVFFFLAVEFVIGGLLNTANHLRAFGFGFPNKKLEGLDNGDKITYELDESSSSSSKLDEDAEVMDDILYEPSPVFHRGHVRHQQSHEVRGAHLPVQDYDFSKGRSGDILNV